MNQLLGRPGGLDAGRYSDNDLASPPSAGRPLPGHGPEQAFFQVDLRRSLEQHGGLARMIALGGVALAVLYVMAQVFWFKTWPVYEAESTVYVKTTPTKVLESSPGARWPFDNNTYESYIQQQMMNVSRADVLMAAVHKLDNFEGPGESDESAAQRLVRTLDVTRMGDAYEFTISARTGNPVMAAAIANAVTQAYIESASRDEHSGDAQRAAMLKEEKDRIQTALAADHTEQESLNGQLGVASVSATVPDHYDQDITEMRSELVKARTDHDAAEAKFAALGAGSGASSSAIDAQADEIISSDAGLVSMKTALNARRATLISQMANLTPANPQYKQDEQELTRINSDLEAMMKDLRSKAAARIQLQLRAELQRTGGVESQLNGQLRQLVGSATSATPKLQRSSDLAADMTRLQARYAAVDEQLHDLILEDNAPGEAYQVTPATPPLTRTKSGVMRNAIGIVLAGLGFGLIAAVLAQKLDPKVYIAADVEQVLGFAPLAQLPDFNEVTEGVAEEYVLRLASAVEHGRKQGDLKNCIFTGTASGAGVSTLLNRVRAMLQAMGRPTVLVNATGAQPPTPRTAIGAPKGSPGLVPALRLSQSTALLREMAGETEEGEDSLVLTDTAPLAVSAETEYLARFVDCAIVVIESGVTTRTQLREAAATLQRLDVGAVGFVLNRVRLATADRGFRQAVEAVEKHVLLVSNPARRQDKSGPFAVESPVVVEMPKAADPAPARAASTRSMFEPEVAAAAAAVARFSPAPLAKAAPASAVCMPSGMVSSQSSEAVKRFTVPLAVEIPEAAAPAAVAVEPAVLPEAAEAQNGREDSVVASAEQASASDEPASTHSSSVTAEAAVAAHEVVTAPFVEATKRFASAAPSEAGNSFYPRPISVAEPVAPLRAVAEAPLAPPANPEVVPQELGEKTLPVAEASLPEVKLEPEAAALNAPEFTWESEPVQTVQSEAPLASPTEPSAAAGFFSESLSEPLPEAAPAPAASSPSEDIPWWLSEVVRAPEPVRPPVLWQPARVWTSHGTGATAESQVQSSEAPQSRPPAEPLWTAFKAGPSEQHTSAADAAPLLGEDEPEALQDPESLSSRLSGLRNLLYVLGGKHTAQGETPVTEKASAKAPAFDQRSGWAGVDAAGPMHGASPRVVTAQPEFLPPKSVVIEIDKTDAHVGESSTRQDRRAAFDRVDILPSKRGQYKKI
jgi:capsular polysaccharide biosynthesis protein